MALTPDIDINSPLIKIKKDEQFQLNNINHYHKPIMS